MDLGILLILIIFLGIIKGWVHDDQQNRNLSLCLDNLLSRTDHNKHDRVLYFYEFEYYVYIEQNYHLHSFINYNNISDITRSSTFDFYLLTIKTIDTLQNIVPVLYRRKYFSPVTQIIVVYFGPKEDIPKIFETLWTVHLMNALLIVNMSEMWTYYPLSLGQCKHLSPFYLGQCDQLQTGELEASPLFNEHRSQFYDKCLFRIMTYSLKPYVFPGPFHNNSGFEVQIIKEVVDHLNLDCEYQPVAYPNWGTRLANGTFTYMYKDLYENRTDIILGGLNIKSRFDDDFMYVDPYVFTELSFYIPLAKKKPAWMNIFSIFYSNLWLLVLFTFLGVVFTWMLISPSPIWHDSSFITLGLAVSALPPLQRRTFKLTILYATWVFTAMILATTYQSQLMTFIFKPSRYKQIASLNDMVEDGIDFGGYYTGVNYFDSNDSTSIAIRARWKNCSLEGKECLKGLYVDQNFAWWRNVRTLNLMMMANRSMRAFRIPQSTVFICTMYLRRSSPFVDRISEIISWLKANGLIAKWDQYRAYKLQKLTSEPQTIGMKEISGAGFVYIIGIMIALGGLILELIWFHCFKAGNNV